LDADSTRSKPSSISLTNPNARWAAARGKAQFAYSINYMLEVQCGVLVGVEASSGNRIDEVTTTQSMLDRIESTYRLKPAPPRC